MKKKLFYLISIFIFCFILAFSIFDKVSFAADSGVQYEYETSDGKHGSIIVKSGSSPFILNSQLVNYSGSGKTWHKNLLVYVSADGKYNQNIDGVKFNTVQLWSPDNIQFTSVTPSVPVLSKVYEGNYSFTDPEHYAVQFVKDPSQLPIYVSTYDNSLGSLVLSSDNDYKFLSVMLNSTTIKNRYFTANFSDKTSNNKSFDKIQCMISLKNVYSKNFIGSSVPSDWDYSEGSELRSILPTLYDKNIKVELLSLKDGSGNDSLYSFGIFQDLLDNHNINVDGLFGGALVFDYTLFFRPVTSAGSYGDWISFTPESGFDNDNLYKTSGGLSTLINNSKSSADPTSTDYNFLGNSTSSKTAIGFGSDYDSAVADSNNTYINNYNGSDDSLISNIKGLFSYFVGFPDIVSTIFSWLPSWVLSLFAIGFALFVPIFIYKFVRG